MQGWYAPQDALSRLLAGTGLQARYSSATAFTLVEPAARPSGPDGDRPATVPLAYAGVLQRTVTRALCQWRGAEFGRYRAAWAAPRSRTGDARRDAALTGLMTGLVMDAPPPAGLPQPVLIRLAPRADAAADCRHAAGG